MHILQDDYWLTDEELYKEYAMLYDLTDEQVNLIKEAANLVVKAYGEINFAGANFLIMQALKPATVEQVEAALAQLKTN